MQFSNIPVQYLVVPILIVTFVLLALIARFFPTKTGLIPLAGQGINYFLEFLLAEATSIVRLFFGWTDEVIDEYLSNEKILRGLKTTVLIFSGLLVIASFYASFNASLAFVTSAGIDPAVAWAVSLSVDGFIVLTIIFNNFHAYKGESSKIGTVALTFFTGLSIFFNISHLGLELDLVKITVGGIAPIIVFGGSEMLTMVIRSYTRRANLVTTDADLRNSIREGRLKLSEGEKAVSQMRLTLEGAEREMAEYHASKGSMVSDIAHLEATLKKLDQQFVDKVPNGYHRLDQVQTLLDQGLTAEEIATTMNIKPGTARSYIRSVNGQA